MEDLSVSETEQQTLAIEILIRDRCQELGLSPLELVRRCGFRNTAKGLRRLEQLLRGDFTRSAGLVRMLPAALGVPIDLVKDAVEKTERYLRASEEAAWLSGFRPHGVIITDQSRPHPIFVAAMIGVDRLIRIEFDLAAGETSYVDQAIDSIKSKLKQWNSSFDPRAGIGSSRLPAFGRPTGFVINYAADRAVRFDLAGNAVEILPKAYRIGQVALLLKGKPISAGMLGEVVQFE
jgi:hypothetical protein